MSLFRIFLGKRWEGGGAKYCLSVSCLQLSSSSSSSFVFLFPLCLLPFPSCDAEKKFLCVCLPFLSHLYRNIQGKRRGKEWENVGSGEGGIIIIVCPTCLWQKNVPHALCQSITISFPANPVQIALVRKINRNKKPS